MNIKDLENFRLSDNVKFHDTLNPLLFTGDKMQADVRDQLMEIARDFVDFMGIDNLKVVDVRLYGSNAAYTYTKYSDIDLHILVDMTDISDDEVYLELFNSKKKLYNDSLDITVRGLPVELYMQASTDTVKSLGDYSVLKDRWVSFPKKSKASFEESSVKEKFKRLVILSEFALRSDDIELVDDLLDTLRRYRRAGLATGGEFSPENISYKILRNTGVVDKLYDHRDVLHSDQLSIDEDYSADEPPGPEFKPTMPAGTVKVDVSDVYDWYKLGQHISNLDGLGKHDFGSGPPSTIMAFGSEDQEHKYIDALKKTGLTTTDIDPVDPKQPKSMPRQKVDPTYNVNESKKGYQEIEFVCSNPDFPDATDPRLQQQMFEELKSIPGVIPVLQDQGDYSKGQKSLSALYKGAASEMFIKKLAKQLGVKIDLIQYRNDDYVQRAKSGELEGQIITEASGYIPTYAERNDPRFKTALSVDIDPDIMPRQAKAMGLGKIKRDGRPQELKANGKFSR
jgi:predicted nucleotidyltransferase